MSLPTTRRTFLGAAAATTAGIAFFRLPAASAGTAPSSSPSTDGPYQPTWASIDQHPPAPEWFQDVKFGIYYHWGAFSVPAYGSEWYPRRMYDPNDDCHAHHIATYGDPSVWPYNYFIDGGTDLAGDHVQFAPKLVAQGGAWDPDAWASLFAAAGAKFAGPVAEHHDGFSMWDSQVNEWNSVQRGPQLDLVAHHVEAIRAKGLKIVCALHHAYNFNGYYQFAPQQSDPSLQKLYGQLPTDVENQLWFDKLKEVLDKYSPDMLYQDFMLDHVDEQQRLNFLSYYYNLAVAQNKDVLATYKDGFDNKGEVYDFERGGPGDILTPYWSTDDSVSSSSWCYTEGIGYYSSTQMLHALIDRTSKNGTMTLNIAPMADGTIPQEQQDILLAMGDYLGRFGESIYSTRAWTVYGEGPTKMGGGAFTSPTQGTAQDIRFTRSKDQTVLYATVLGYPGATLPIATLAKGRFDISTLNSVEILSDTAGRYIALSRPAQNEGGLQVRLPSTAPFAAAAYVIKLTFNGSIPPLASPPVPAPATIYTDRQYAGTSAPLVAGTYTQAQLQALGFAPKTVSSIHLATGYRCVGYPQDHLAGTPWKFGASKGDLARIGADDAFVSLVVDFSPTSYFQIANATTGLVLDGGGALSVGSPAKQWTADSSTNLQWQVVRLSSGYYKIVNRTSGLVLDGGGQSTPGSGVTQSGFSPRSTSQQWQVAAAGASTYKLVNRATGLVLDGGGQISAGSLLKQWTWDGSTNLQWSFVLASK